MFKKDHHSSLKITFSEEDYPLVRSILEDEEISCFEEGETIINDNGDLELINDYSVITLRFEDEHKLEEIKNLLIEKVSNLYFNTTFNNPNYLDEWKKHAKLIELTDSVTIHPSWISEIPPSNEKKIINLDAGYAFGSGSHETTQLCAKAIENLSQQFDLKSMLDVGCGSGILSLVGSLSGIEIILGIDIDEFAITSSINNAKKNNILNTNFSTTPISEVTSKFDLVVANIISSVLLPMKDDLIKRINPNGHIILSGILESEIDVVAKSFNLKRLETKVLGEWAVIISSL